MHIAFIVNDFPPCDMVGGIVTYTEHMARAWLDAGHEVSVVAWSSTGRRHEEDLDGIRVVRVVPTDYRGSLIDKISFRLRGDNSSRLLHHKMFSWAVAEEIGAWAFPPDVIEAPEAFGWGWGVMSALEIPVAIRVHGPNVLAARADPDNLHIQAVSVCDLERHCIESASIVVPPTQYMRDAIESESIFGKKVHVVPYPYIPPRARENPSNPGRMIVCVGRLIPGKGFATAIRVLAGLDDEWRLTIIGPDDFHGPDRRSYRAELEELSRALGVADRVSFTGSLPPDAVHDEIARATCLMHDSSNDNMPFVILEALALETAVVASDVGGIPEMLGPHGSVIPLGAIDKYRRVVSGLDVGPVESRRYVMNRFDPIRVQLQMESLYSEFVVPTTETRLEWIERCSPSGPTDSHQRQAVLHDSKGSHISPWPTVPATSLQAQRIDRMASWIHGSPGVILEVGCHRSGLLQAFHLSGWQVRGIDVSPESIKDQNRYLPGRFACAPAEDIPLPDNCVDLVVAAHVLEHVDDLHRALDEIQRVLKPGGRLHVEVPLKDMGLSLEGFRLRWNPEQWKKESSSVGHDWDRLPVSSEFLHLLESRGFLIDEARRGAALFGPVFDSLITGMALHRVRSGITADGPADAGGGEPESVRLRRARSTWKRRLAAVPARFMYRIDDAVLTSWGNGSCLFVSARTPG